MHIGLLGGRFKQKVYLEDTRTEGQNYKYQSPIFSRLIPSYDFGIVDKTKVANILLPSFDVFYLTTGARSANALYELYNYTSSKANVIEKSAVAILWSSSSDEGHFEVSILKFRRKMLEGLFKSDNHEAI